MTQNHQERIATLGQAVFNSRRCYVEPIRVSRAIRRRLGYIWDVPGPLGDGLVNLIERVEDNYQDAIREGVYDVAVIGALRAGYASGREQDGESFATQADMHRWLSEPASRADALVLLCELLGMQAPKNLLAAIEAKPEE